MARQDIRYPTDIRSSSIGAAHLKAVIVGAGPAGLLAAILLSKRGYNVEVYDKLPSPRAVSVEEKRRTIVFGITPRGRDALLEAGVSLPTTGWLHGIAVGRMTVIHNYPKRTMKTPSKHIIFAERTALIDHLTSEARRLAPPGRCAFFYEHTLLNVDFEQRQCSFAVGPNGEATTVNYELLIAADGIRSGVRDLLQRHDPSLKVVAIPCGKSYKAFHGLKPVGEGEWRMSGTDGADLHSMFGKGGKWSLAVWPTRENMVAGVLNGDEGDMERLLRAGDYGELILTQFPSFPRKWVLDASNQLAGAQARPFGASVRCSRLHGPSVALLGDAAHGVTPYLGQGCNAALESASILTQSLDAAGGNIQAGLERYTDTRLADAHGLHVLDLQARARIGLCGSCHPRFLGTVMHVMFWMFINCITFGRAEQPYLDVLMGKASYAKGLRAVQRDDVIGVAVLIAAASAACYWAVNKVIQWAPHVDPTLLQKEGMLGSIAVAVVGGAMLVRAISKLSG